MPTPLHRLWRRSHGIRGPGRATDHRDRLFQQLFDRLQFAHLGRRTERNHSALGPGTRSPANPVDIVFRHVRHFIVINVAHTRNVDATRGHIGRHQHLHAAFTELGQRLVTLVLALVAVDRPGLKAPGQQQLVQFFAAMLGAAKYQSLLAHMLFQIGFQQLGLVAIGDVMDTLHDLINRLAGRGNLHLDRVAQIGAGQFLDVFGHGGRKQQGLTLDRDMFGDLPQAVDESHVQHLVRLVQHQIAGILQADIATLDQVDQAARRCHQHIGTL